MKADIEKLRKSKEDDDRRSCLALLDAYLGEHPTDAQAWYDKAGCHDFLGEEVEAEPCYRKCYDLGWWLLPDDEQPRFFVGYGSTLRNNLKFAESIRVLEEATRSFPGYPALWVFLALSYCSSGKDPKATRALLKNILSISQKGLDGFERAIEWYAEHLDEHPVRRSED